MRGYSFSLVSLQTVDLKDQQLEGAGFSYSHSPWKSRMMLYTNVLHLSVASSVQQQQPAGNEILAHSLHNRIKYHVSTQ